MSTANSGASRDEQLAAALALPPPRKLPREVRRSALRQAAPLSFAVFGLLFGGFGVLFVWIFFPWHINRDWQLMQPDTLHGNGTILAVADTRLSINKTKIAVYAFEFRTTSGTVRRGECFTTGRLWKPGELVQVLYREEAPSIACPVGGRLSATGVGSIFVAIFPIGGAALVAWVFISRHRILNIFRNGQVLEAFITDIEHTQTMVNDYPLFKITFERADIPHASPIILRRWKPKVVAFLQVRQQTKQPVFLLSDPRKPTNYLLPETM